MNIGDPIRTFTVEPLEDPFTERPDEEPAPEREREREAEPDLVPA